MTMQALTQPQYGDASVLTLSQIPKPVPKNNEVLIRIHATSINDYDWCLMRGKPYLYRLMFGLFKPKSAILGMELAGTIETIGSDVQRFKVGDAVYGDISDHGFGTFAQYICIDQQAVNFKPEGMNFTDAAALPHAGALAVQALVGKGGLNSWSQSDQSGLSILINGAGGGVGAMALSIAKQVNATVTGVDTGEKLAAMSANGFDQVIDYQSSDFNKNGQQYDLILDTKSTRSPLKLMRSLKPGGKYITVGGNLWRILQTALFTKLAKLLYNKQCYVVALKTNQDLQLINELYALGKLKLVIDGPHPLSDAPQQIERFGLGQHSGKIVIEVR